LDALVGIVVPPGHAVAGGTVDATVVDASVAAVGAGVVTGASVVVVAATVVVTSEVLDGAALDEAAVVADVEPLSLQAAAVSTIETTQPAANARLPDIVIARLLGLRTLDSCRILAGRATHSRSHRWPS
jgi:hypothetical protein